MKLASDSPSPRQSIVYDSFISADFAKAPTNVSFKNSPYSLNMVRDEAGKVRKRMGYFLNKKLDATIYGIHKHNENFIYHCGSKLYDGDKLIYSDMNEHLSKSWQIDGKIYFIDGKTLLVYNGDICAPVSGKIPLIMIGGTPQGGGTQFEQVNLIQNKWEQNFKGDGTTKVYQLAFPELDATTVDIKRARLENSIIVWDPLNETVDFTVDRPKGIITFITAPSAPVFAQEDNIKITASKDRSKSRSAIFKCDLLVGFGINGYDNQMFISGNPDAKNKVYWCGVNDPTYWGDLQYAALGQSDSAIMGFTKQNAMLAIHKDIQSGDTYICDIFSTKINELETPHIKVSRVVNGSGVICKNGFVEFGESLFITQLGVQTITTQDMSNRELEQVRGDRINKRLLGEPSIKTLVACRYKDYALFAVNGNVYVIDRLQKAYEPNTPMSTFQYGAYFWDDIPATCFYTDGDVLYFGTAEGEIMQFYSDDAAPVSYSDNGKMFRMIWEFPEYVGGSFYSNKAIKFVAIRLKAYVRTSVTLDIQLEGIWYNVLHNNVDFGYLDLDELDLNNLSLSTDTTPKKATEKYSQRKLDKFAFRISSNAINEPFGLYSFAFEVKEKGKHKG